MNYPIANPLRSWVSAYHEGCMIDAAKALNADKSTLYRVIDTAYVIDGRLYTIKRKTS